MTVTYYISDLNPSQRFLTRIGAIRGTIGVLMAEIESGPQVVLGFQISYTQDHISSVFQVVPRNQPEETPTSVVRVFEVFPRSETYPDNASEGTFWRCLGRLFPSAGEGINAASAYLKHRIQEDPEWVENQTHLSLSDASMCSHMYRVTDLNDICRIVDSGQNGSYVVRYDVLAQFAVIGASAQPARKNSNGVWTWVVSADPTKLLSDWGCKRGRVTYPLTIDVCREEHKYEA